MSPAHLFQHLGVQLDVFLLEHLQHLFLGRAGLEFFLHILAQAVVEFVRGDALLFDPWGISGGNKGPRR